MAEILGLGMSHWPRLGQRNENLSILLRGTLEDPDIPAERKDPANWPARMREEWGNDEGFTMAEQHRASMAGGLRRLRGALDAFKPDAVIVWGDDQYENFRDDVIPAFCVCAFQEDVVSHPWASKIPNYWNEPPDKAFTVKMAPEIGKYLATGLLESDFDVAYAYKPLHHVGLAHAFMNTVLYLDYDRTGFPYPMVPFQVNCYGRHVISHRGVGWKFAQQNVTLDPPSPSPKRCFDIGAATARVMKASPYRVALIASSSWSHAFLVDKHWHLYPDVAADRRLYELLQAGDLAAWRETPLAAVEEAGEHEMLNWFCLAGAMHELGYVATWSEFVETYVYNSNKVNAIFGPAEAAAGVRVGAPA